MIRNYATHVKCFFDFLPFFHVHIQAIKPGEDEDDEEEDEEEEEEEDDEE